MNYTIKKDVMQGQKPLNYARTHYNCKPQRRCKQIHKCEACHEIHAKKQLKNHLNHITDKQLKKFKFAKYVTITPKHLVKDFEIHNSNIDIYNQYLTSADKRRFKSHPFYNCEYITFKEITKSEGNGQLFPHIHAVVFTNENLLFESELFDFDIRDIKIDLNPNYKNDYRNPLTQTIKKIFKYSTKIDKARLSYERTFNTSRGKSDIKISKIFKTKPIKSHVLTPLHIQHIKLIRKQCRQGRKQALLKHSHYKQQKGNINTKAVHLHALKTKRKIDRLEKTKKELIKRAQDKLKRFSVRRERRKNRTHPHKSNP